MLSIKAFQEISVCDSLCYSVIKCKLKDSVLLCVVQR